MSWLNRIFTTSPFSPLIEHQERVLQCVLLANDIVDAALNEDSERVRELAKRISQLERAADEIKDHVRSHLPKSIFMPVSRSDLLDVLAAQDAIADAAEDLGVLLTMRKMGRPPEEIVELLKKLIESAVGVVKQTTEIVRELRNLVDLSFTGPDALRVLKMIDEVGRQEHLADKVQDKLAKTFFRYEDSFKPAEIYLWMKIFNKIGDLANIAEKATHRVRLFLAD